MLNRILTTLSTRDCKGGCGYSDFHTAHLTGVGKARIKWWGFKSRAASRLQVKAASLLPRWLVYRAAIRLGAEVTTGRWSSTIVPDLTFMDAIKRWDEPELLLTPVDR